jgi:hypothetical protein
MRFKYRILMLFVICCFVLFETVVFSQKSDDSTKRDIQNTSSTKATRGGSEKKSGPTITFESTVQDLGEIGPSSRKSGEFKFTNTGDDVLKIQKVSKTCGCTTSKLDKKEYAPGESGTLKVTYRASKTPTTVKKNVYVTSNDQKHPKVTLTIQGQVVAKVEHNPRNLQLMLRKDNAGCPEITLKSKDKKPFSIKRFQSTSQCISAEFDSSTKKDQYVLQPKVDLEKVGKSKNGHITIQLDHPQCKWISIPFKVIPEFKTKPAGLTLLQVQPEKTITRELWVLSTYNEDFEIESITSQRGYTKVANQEKNGNGYKIDLEITPPKPSDKKSMFQDKIYVKIKDGDKLEVSCFGVYPKE